MRTGQGLMPLPTHSDMLGQVPQFSETGSAAEQRRASFRLTKREGLTTAGLKLALVLARYKKSANID